MHTHLTMPARTGPGGTVLQKTGQGAGLDRTGLGRTNLSATGLNGTGLNAAGRNATGQAGGTASAAQPSPKLVHAAHEFEGMLMEELLKPLASGGVPGDDEDDDGGGFDNNDSDGLGSAGAIGSFAVDSLSQAISNAGGFGIANQLIAQLTRREASQSSRSGNTAELMRAIGKGTGRAKIKPLK